MNSHLRPDPDRPGWLIDDRPILKTHVFREGKIVPIEAAPVVTSAPAASVAPASLPVAAPAPVRAAAEIAEMQRAYDAIQAQWAREQRFAAATARWIAAGGPAPSEGDLAASELLLWAIDPAAAKSPGDSPGLKKFRDTTAPTGPVDPRPSEHERKPKLPGKPAEPSQADKDELERLLDRVMPKRRKAAEASAPDDEFSAAFGAAIANQRARRARGL